MTVLENLTPRRTKRSSQRTCFNGHQGLELCWGLSSASVPGISREGENIIIYPRVEKRGGQVYRSEWEVYVGGGGGGGGKGVCSI